jgi:8-oxo-dGTP pyrophosphatase MutT (NUDIX family)
MVNDVNTFPLPKLPKIASPQQLELPDRTVLNDFAYEEPEYKKAAKAFGLETKALGGGAVALGAEALKGVTPDVVDPYLDKAADWGMGVYEDQMALIPQRDLTADVEKIEDIKFGEKGGFDRFTDWASYHGTKGLLDVATMVAGGGIGGAVAKTAARQGVKKAVKGAATDQLKRKAAEAGAKKVATAGKVGQTLGSTVPMAAKEGGGSYGSLVSEGVAPEKAVLPSLAVGVINASLEYVPVLSALNRVKAGFGREALGAAIRSDATLKKKAAHIAKEALYGTGSQAAQEGLTEATQELVTMAAARITKDEKLLAPLSAEEKSAFWNAMAVGGLVGGGMGSATGSVKGLGETMVKSPQERQEEAVAREEAQAKKEQAAHEERIKAAEGVVEGRGLGDTEAGLREAGPDAGYEARSFVQDTVQRVPESQQDTDSRQDTEQEEEPSYTPRQHIKDMENREVKRKFEEERLAELREKAELDPEAANEAKADAMAEAKAKVAAEAKAKGKPAPAPTDSLELPPAPPPTQEEQAYDEEMTQQVEDLWAAAAAEQERSAGPKTEESLLREWGKQKGIVEEVTLSRGESSSQDKSLDSIIQDMTLEDEIRFTQETGKSPKDVAVGEVVKETGYTAKSHIKEKMAEGYAQDKGFLDTDAGLGMENPASQYEATNPIKEAGIEPAPKAPIKETTDLDGLSDTAKQKLDEGWEGNADVSWDASDKLNNTKSLLNAFAKGDPVFLKEQVGAYDGFYGNGTAATVIKDLVAENQIEESGSAAVTKMEVAGKLELPEYNKELHDKGWDLEFNTVGLPMYMKDGSIVAQNVDDIDNLVQHAWTVFTPNKAPNYADTLNAGVAMVESGNFPGLKAQTQEGGMLEGEWAMAITDPQKEAEFAESWGKQTLDLLNNGANPDFVYDIASKLQEAGSIDAWEIKQGMPGGATLKMTIQGTHVGNATKVNYSPEDNSAIMPTTLLGFSEVTEFTGEEEVQSLFNVLSAVPDVKNKMKEIKADKELYGENALAAKWGSEAASFLVDNPAEAKTYVKALGKVPVEKWENYDEGWVAGALHTGTLSGINKEGIESMVNEGFSPKTVADTAGMLDELVHLGWEYKGIDKSSSPYKVIFKTDSPSAAILYSPKTGVAELFGSGQLGGSPFAPYQLSFGSIDEAIAAYDNAGAGTGAGATASTASAAAAANTEWAPQEPPPGYTIESSKITSMDGMHVYFTSFLSNEDATAIAHIHNYFKYAKIPTIEKIQLYKEMPKSKQELESFKVNHPYLLRKVTIGETNDVTQGTKLLHEIVSNHDKYGLEDVMQEAGLFADKFGDEALKDALKSAPKKVVDVPNLDGWLEDLRPEEDLLAENPFEGVWANYPVNSDHNPSSATYGETGARYGVVIINPKTGKVLLRKVSNQYEGITWDFARGGADRFSDPGPNRIDTGHHTPSKRYMEHPLVAAKREAKEEFGYDVQIVGQLAKGFYSGRDGTMASLYYVGVPTGEQSTDHLSGPHQETDATQWASLPEARRLVTTQPTLGPSQSMKRDGYHRPRIARIARTLEAVFDSNMQKSDLGYRGNPKAMQAYRDGDLATDFPAVFKAVENKPKVEDMTETQKIKLSSALYVARRLPNASKLMKDMAYKQEFKKRNAALNAWVKSRVGETGTVSGIMSGGATLSSIQNKLQQTGGKIVLSLWHGSKDREALLGDVIDPQFFGSGVGGADTKEGMFLASTRKAAKKWARARQVNVLVAFENLKVIPNEVGYGSTSFTHILQQAKADGYDGVFFNKVHDAVTGRQIVVWKGENVIAGGGENVGFTGKTLYQTKGELGDALDLSTATELLREDLGPITDALLSSGMLELVEGGGPDGVAGQYDAATDTIKVYLDYVSSPRELLGAVLHEGSHARLVSVLGKSAVKYHEDFLKQGGSAADARFKTAWEGALRFGIASALSPENTSEINRVREELRKISPDFLMEEDLANYVQFAQGKDEGLFRRIVNAVKAWWASTALGRSLKQKGFGFEFTDEMAVALVRQGLRNQVNATSDGLFNTYIAHTSGAQWASENKFPHGRPLLKYVLKGQGEGNISYGWGFYALESQATLDYYKQGVGSNTYGMHVPDDIVPKMIEWDRPLNQQSPQVQRALLDPRDDYLLLRLALKAKNKTSTYPTSPSLDIKGTGSSFYSELTKYYMDKEYGGMDGHIHDPETGKQQRKKNLARRMASRKLAEYGLAGIRLLDAGSRVVYVRKNTDGTYEVRKGIGHSTKVSTVDQAGLEKEAGKHIAEKAAQQQIGETVKHPGFGFYNWVFWRQEDLDRLTVVYKKGQKVAGNPKKNAAYDVNGVGLPYPEHPGVSDYVVDPKTGDQKYYSKEGRTMAMEREDLVQQLDKEMGQGWVEQAEAAGLVEIINEPGPNGESGSWDGQRIRLYAGSMPASGGPAGVLLHEGKHATFKEVLGDSLGQYVGDLHTMAEAGNELARRAMTQATLSAADSLGVEHYLREEWAGRGELDRVRREVEQKSPGLLAEEDLAYFVQYGAEGQGNGLFRRLVDKIKAWWASTALGQMLKERGIGFELTEGMAVIWAQRGLHGALNMARGQAQQSMAVNREAAYMSAAGRVGRALDAAFDGNEYQSQAWEEVKGYLWTDPTDGREDQVNKPGLLQRIRADFIDYFAEMEAVDTGVYDVYSLVRNKKAARLEQIKQEYALPLRSKIADSPWTAEEVSDMLAARHIKVDGVNRKLAERASDMYAKRLLKKDVLPEVRAKELSKARGFVRVGKNPDGSDYVDAQGNQITMSASTKRKLMFDLVNYYIPYEIKQGGEQLLRNDWEVFKDAASGFSDGGVGSAFVRGVDQVLDRVSADQGKWDEITNLYDSLNRMTLDILEDGGLITEDEKARLIGDKTAYAPLRREAYNLNDEIQKIFQQAGAGGAKQLATRAGTETLSEPVMALQNALAKAEAAAAAAERNFANNYLYETINQDREGWKSWFAVVDKDKYATHDENGFLVEKKSTAQNKSDIVLLRGGKKLIIRPNAHNERALGFVRAVNNLDAQVLNGPMRVMNWLNGIVRWVNVSASPAFLMMNAVRDPFTAAYNMQASEAKEYTSEIFANYGKTFTALKKVFVQGVRDPADADVQMVERWEKAGGRTSFIESLKEMDDSWGSFEAQVARRQGGAKALFEMKDKWLDGIENTNILFENVMRLSTFSVLVDKGVSEQRAARISQDLTTNFTRRGYKTQALGVWWLFFNATVQGNYQVVRNLLGSKKLQGITAGTIGFSLMLDVMGRMMFDDWDEIPEWDKERFIIAPVKVGGDFVKIPAPWVYNVVWRMGGMLGETLAGVRKPQDMLLDLSAMTMTTFNPVGSASLAQAISPTAMDPFVQILENKDFAGNPLAPEAYPGVGKRPNAELAWGSTPEGYKWLAEYVNEATGGSPVESGIVDLRPADYKVLVNFLTGSLGRFLTDTTLGIKGAAQGELELEGPKDLPLVGGLFADPSNPMRSEKYHTRVAAAYGAAKLEKLYKEGPERDMVKLMEVRRERAGDLRIYRYAQDVERQIKEIRKKVKRAEGRGDERTMEVLRGRIDRLKEQFNRSYEVRVGK